MSENSINAILSLYVTKFKAKGDPSSLNISIFAELTTDYKNIIIIIIIVILSK